MEKSLVVIMNSRMNMLRFFKLLKQVEKELYLGCKEVISNQVHVRS
jgi:hypothetical protein